MQPVFENQYVITKNKYLEWAKRPVTKDAFSYIWIALSVFLIVFAIFAIVNGDVLSFSIYLLLELFCIYRLFFRKKLLFLKQFQKIAVIQGKKEWDRIIRFSDKITMIDGNTTTEYEWSQVKEFIIDRDYLLLVMEKRLGVRIDKSGFTKGSCEVFVDYMKNMHDNIPLKVRK